MAPSKFQEKNARAYNVLFCGELAEGFSPGAVKQKLMKMFNVPEQLIEGAYSGTPLLVKERVDLQTAQQYKNIFEKAGTICRIEDVEQEQPDKSFHPLEQQHIARLRNEAVDIAQFEGWEVNECEGETQIQLVNRRDDLCITILSERKTEFSSDFDYMDFAREACDYTLKKDSSYQKSTGPVGLFINRMRGVRYEISGKPGTKRLKTLQVTLDGKQYFHLFLATAAENVYPASKPIFEEILLTFREQAP